jgi:hypothetical protein
LCLSNDERGDFVAILRLVSAIADGWAERTVAARKRLAAQARFADALAIVASRDSALAARTLADVASLASTPSGLAPPPLITGDDLAAMGRTPGPGFRAALDAAYDAQLEGRATAKAQALAIAVQTLEERRD